MAATVRSPTLSRAKKWAEDLGNTVDILDATTTAGQPVQVLQIHRGQIVVLVLETRPGVLEIDCPQDLPKEVKEKLSKLTPELQQQVMVTFLDRLVRHPRSGFAIQPTPIKALHEIDRWVVTQAVVVKGDDSAAHQRFADALQEVVSVFMGAGMVLAAVMQSSPPGASTGSSPVAPPPSAMYR